MKFGEGSKYIIVNGCRLSISLPVAGVPTSPHERKQIVVRAYAYVDWWGHQPRVQLSKFFNKSTSKFSIINF